MTTPRKRTSKFTWAVTIGLIAIVTYFIWGVFFLHVYEPSGSVTAEKASAYTEIAIPPEATNIRIIGSNQLIFFERRLRFEAPLAVCLHSAAAAVPGVRFDKANEDDLMRVRPISPGGIPEPAWFDLSKASNVIVAGGGPGKPRVWVDLDRGVFYCIISD